MLHSRGNVLGRVHKTILLAGRRFSSDKAPLVEVGHFADPLINGQRYEAGQIFLNRTFAYRGIVIASFDCKEFRRKENNSYIVSPYYQVLVHQDDWKEMRFPNDHTSYLSETKEGKVLNVIRGMDSVSHEDILPLSIVAGSSDEFKAPIEHELFNTLFKLADDSKPELGFVACRNLTKQRTWMQPQMTLFENTESIYIMLTTYYLGSSNSSGQAKHYWRYVIRIQNLGSESVILRERNIKIFSLNNLTQITAQGVVGDFPILSQEHPAFQFSSTIDLPQRKGGHMWGKLLMTRQDASTFEVDIPTVVLECSENSCSHTIEKIH